MAPTPKAKISLSLDAPLLRQVDRSVEANRYPSRSAAVESALRIWAERDRRLQSDAAIEAYYAGLSDDERADDKAWADFATREYVHLARGDAALPTRPRKSRPRRRT